MDISALLREKLPRLQLEENFSFAAHTTIGCGGAAAVCAYPADEAEAEALLALLLREKLPHVLLGLGANTLAPDGRYEGVVVRFSRMNRIRAADGVLVAGAGATGAELLAFARRERIGGFEPFFGIPMTVGGATAMNAGVREGHISDLAAGVRGIERGKLRRFTLAECAFSEKHSVFSEGIAVTEVMFRAEADDPAAIAARTRFFAARRQRLPKGRSMGCTFVNPEGRPAGELIQSCGLKGTRCGGAVVSREHANFILNEGGSAADVARLIDFVKEEVYRRTGVLLREEIRRISF